MNKLMRIKRITEGVWGQSLAFANRDPGIGNSGDFETFLISRLPVFQRKIPDFVS